MLALDMIHVLAISISLNEEEALTVLRITVPIKVQATRLRITSLGVPVDLLEEGLCIFGLYVEFYVNQNHWDHLTYPETTPPCSRHDLPFCSAQWVGSVHPSSLVDKEAKTS